LKVLGRDIGIALGIVGGTVLLGAALVPVATFVAASAGASAGTTATVATITEAAAVGLRAARVVVASTEFIVGASIGTGVVATGGLSYAISKAFPLLIKSIKKA
jgi:hypothetical protein